MLDKLEIAKMNAEKQLESNNIVIGMDEYFNELNEHFKEIPTIGNMIIRSTDHRGEDNNGIAYNEYAIGLTQYMKLEELTQYVEELTKMVDKIRVLENTFKYKNCEVGF